MTEYEGKTYILNGPDRHGYTTELDVDDHSVIFTNSCPDGTATDSSYIRLTHDEARRAALLILEGIGDDTSDAYTRGYQTGASDMVGRVREFALHELTDPAGVHTWSDDLNPEGFRVG